MSNKLTKGCKTGDKVTSHNLGIAVWTITTMLTY